MTTLSRTSKAPRRLMTLFLVVVIAGAIVILVEHFFQSPGCLRTPTPQDRLQMESLVKQHLPDAENFTWTVADCDENGQVTADFTTQQRGSDASRAFLSDPACKNSIEPDASPGDVTCKSKKIEFSIYFQDNGARYTHGTLAVESF